MQPLDIRMTYAKSVLAAAAALLSLVYGSEVKAEEYSATDLQLFHTTRSKADPANGTGTSDEKLTVLRSEHFGTWSHGDNYLNLDIFRGNQVGGPGAGSFGADSQHQYFFVWVSRVGLHKPFGIGTSGFLKGLYATYRMERASYGDFRADNIGVSMDLAVPGTAFFEQDFYVRNTNYDRGTKFLSRTVWLAPFQAGPLNMHFDGLVLAKTTQNSGTDVLAQTDLLVDLTPKGGVQTGLRVEHHRYKGYSRTSPFLLMKWVL